MDLIVQDFEETNIERPQMVAKLLLNFEQGMQKGLLNNQASLVAASDRQIILLAGLAADSSYDNRVKKFRMRSIFSFRNPKLIHTCEGIGMLFFKF